MAFGLRKHLSGDVVGRAEIEKALKTAGLPSIATIYADAKAAVARVPGRAAVHPKLAEIRTKLIAAGQKLHCQPDFDAAEAHLCPVGELPAPLAGDSECEVFSLGAAPLDWTECEFLFECHEKYREVLRSALRAARGFEFELTDFVY